MKEFKKTGYLNNDFKIFHLIDQGMAPVNFHFHEFHKILILLKGNVSYCIEGRSYDLQPDDVVFVPAGEVHCPVVHDQNTYERIIIYISKGYLDGYRTDSYPNVFPKRIKNNRMFYVFRLLLQVNSDRLLENLNIRSTQRNMQMSCITTSFF